MTGDVRDGAQKLVGMLKRRERKGKGFRHGICVGNWWLKQQGYSKDTRRQIWSILFESGLLLRRKNSVWLLSSIIKMTPSLRKEILPTTLFKQFSVVTEGRFNWYILKERENSIKPEVINHPIYGKGIIQKKFDGKVRIKFEDGQESIFNYQKLVELGAV